MSASEDATQTILEEALKEAADGVELVIPVWGKKPLEEEWQLNTVSSPHEIAERFKKNDGCNYGIFHGRSKFGPLTTLDCDGELGLHSLKLLKERGFEIPDTRIHRTPSGGAHLIFYSEKPVTNGSSLFQKELDLPPDAKTGLDIKSGNAQIVGPGSSIGGKSYTRQNNLPYAKCPDWIVKSQGEASPKVERGLTVVAGIDPALAERQAMAFLKSQPIVTEGKRNNIGFWAACEVKDRGVNMQTCLLLMNQFWKHEPQLDPSEIETFVRSAYKTGQNPQGSKNLGVIFDKIEIEPAVTSENPKILIESYAEIQLSHSRPQLIENLIDVGAFASLVGLPNCGKTFLALYMALCVALGRSCFGKRTDQGASLYFPLEGGTAFKKRVVADRIYHKLENAQVPFAIGKEHINLIGAEKHGALVIDTIRAAEMKFGMPVKLVVFDTLNRLMAGGNENSTEDMTLLIGRLDLIRKETGAAVLLTHHMGKTPDKGARGSSALIGAVDTELQVQTGVIRISKQRDMEIGPNLGFKLETVEIGVDANGAQIKSCIVEPRNTRSKLDFEERIISPRSVAGKAFAVIKDLTALKGRPHNGALDPLEDNLKPDTLIVSKADWRDEFVAKCYPKSPQATQRSSFLRAFDELIQNSSVGNRGDHVWIID